MKKITFLIFGLCWSFKAISQQIPSSEVLTASMPPGSKLLTQDQLVKFTRKNFTRTPIPADKKNIYQLDGIIISFWDIEQDTEYKRSLEEIRSGMLGVLKYAHDTVNFSKIITINNSQFLVYEYQKEDEVYL